jgi:hypothetical protein
MYMNELTNQDSLNNSNKAPGKEASILEICVYPVIAREKMRQLADAIRSWAARF